MCSYAMQTRWRSKIAKQELRRRRAEARESGKLLQDKQALELRVKEMQSILETVQNQRNELKQQFKACLIKSCCNAVSLCLAFLPNCIIRNEAILCLFDISIDAGRLSRPWPFCIEGIQCRGAEANRECPAEATAKVLSRSLAALVILLMS